MTNLHDHLRTWAALGLTIVISLSTGGPSLAQSATSSAPAAKTSTLSAEERAAARKARKAERAAAAEAARQREAEAAAEKKAARAQARLERKNAEAAKQAATTKPEPRAATGSRAELRSQASQMAAGFIAAEAALSPAELAIAQRVHTGVLPCELGAVVTLESDPGMPGYFNMSGKNFRYRMIPVVSATGAIRLEDREAGAVWLQLANKSMLMNQKAGRRMADECMSPAQEQHARYMKTNPGPVLLEGMAPASGTTPAPAGRRAVQPRTAP